MVVALEDLNAEAAVECPCCHQVPSQPIDTGIDLLWFEVALKDCDGCHLVAFSGGGPDSYDSWMRTRPSPGPVTLPVGTRGGPMAEGCRMIVGPVGSSDWPLCGWFTLVRIGRASLLTLLARLTGGGGEDVLQVASGVANCNVSHQVGGGPRLTEPHGGSLELVLLQVPDVAL